MHSSTNTFLGSYFLLTTPTTRNNISGPLVERTLLLCYSDTLYLFKSVVTNIFPLM